MNDLFLSPQDTPGRPALSAHPDHSDGPSPELPSGQAERLPSYRRQSPGQAVGTGRATGTATMRQVFLARESSFLSKVILLYRNFQSVSIASHGNFASASRQKAVREGQSEAGPTISVSQQDPLKCGSRPSSGTGLCTRSFHAPCEQVEFCCQNSVLAGTTVPNVGKAMKILKFTIDKQDKVWYYIHRT